MAVVPILTALCFDSGPSPPPARQLRALWPLHDIAMPTLCGIYCNNGGSVANIILRNCVGDIGVRGVPKQTVGAQRTVLIRAQKPRNQTMSCIG